MHSSVWLQNLTWEEIQEKIKTSRRTIIMPIGSTEQHGPHLPVGADTMVAMALAEAAAEKNSVLVAPPLWFGWSPHHMILAGTITIRPEILIEICYDMISSLHHHGFEKFILLNGHRIVNVTWLQIAAERAKRNLGAGIVIFDPAYMSKEITRELGWGEIGHAEEIESSHIWYCYPDLVKMSRARDNPHKHHPRYHVDPAYSKDTLCYVPSSVSEQQQTVLQAGGTSGEPSKASREGGKAYHEHLVARLSEVIEKLHLERPVK
ncbi:MAG: creatininase family protein [Thermodesulfobacteriota bacterium]